MKNVPMKGIITPILTPMNPDETVNLEVLRQQIERLIEGGVHGIFPLGTNGEAYALSFDEKLAIIETCVDQVKGRVPVYAGTGCITTRETIELSKRAADLGADILSIITPSFAVASQKEMYDHYVEVASCYTTSPPAPATSCCLRPSPSWQRTLTSSWAPRTPAATGTTCRLISA